MKDSKNEDYFPSQPAYIVPCLSSVVFYQWKPLYSKSSIISGTHAWSGYMLQIVLEVLPYDQWLVAIVKNTKECSF
jgi:hypothetical protein